MRSDGCTAGYPQSGAMLHVGEPADVSRADEYVVMSRYA